MPTEPKRQRIVREATRQFAEKGYERTTIANIEAASGLSAGAGGLYRHFSSKQALLEEAVLRVITSFESRAAGLAVQTDAEPRAFLEQVGKAVLDDFADERDSVRIVLRDLDQFPDLQTAFRERRLRPGFNGLAAWLQAQVDAGRLRAHDTEAMAVVLLGPLIFLRVAEALMGEAPVPVEDNRVLAAWLDLATAGLAPGR